jgi:hypothetical protein
MSMVRCRTCGKKIDTSFYGACLDCGTLLSTGSEEDPARPALRTASPSPVSRRPVEPAPNSVEDHIARYGGDTPATETEAGSSGGGRTAAVGAGVIIRLVIVGVVIFGGALWGFVFNADRDESGVIVDAGSLTPDELRVGDCLDWPGQATDEVETFDTVKAMPCGDPHDLEVYHLATYPGVDGEPYPGDEVLIEYGAGACYDAFGSYIGTPYEMVPDVDFTLFWPTEESWRIGDRTIHCLLVHIDEGVKITGSLSDRDA